MSETTHVGIDVAKKLDGSETVMFAILVDSWGDKLVVELTCDENMGEGKISKIETADFFMPCAHCGNAVLVCNFESDNDFCDRCKTGHKSGYVPPTKFTDGFDGLGEAEFNKLVNLEVPMLMEDRIKTAVQEAHDAFWAVIVKHFPDATDGSFLMSDMDDIMLSWVNHWVDCNVPRPETVHRGDLYLLDELHLHYRDTWHLLHTGGGCMVALTDNVAVGGKYYYMGVTSECVCIYEDTFSEEQFMVEHITAWTFGDNPTVLMNQIDEFMGGTGYWDTGKLFDDIMTIGKSNNVM